LHIVLPGAFCQQFERKLTFFAGQVIEGRMKNALTFTSTRDELASSVVHGIGAALSAAALCILVSLAALRGDAWRVVSFSIYGSALVLLYLVSTLYHSFRSRGVRRVFQILDHSFIYILIAGTYTPFCLVTMNGWAGWALFGTIWGLAVIGVTLNTALFGRFLFFSQAMYVAMGWLVVAAIYPLWRALPPAGLAWLAGGGVLYTAGLVFFGWRAFPFHHTVWHLFVIAGSACHFFAMLLYVLPK
jgi:hemolysin III